VHNKNALAKTSELSFIVKHFTLLAFAFFASILFKGMGFISTTQIPLTILLAFISLEWVYYQHKSLQGHKLNQ